MRDRDDPKSILSEAVSPQQVDLPHMRRDYGRRTLDERDVLADPIDQFRHWFDDARASDIMEPNAMTLATVDASGAADARIVLLKGVRTDGLVFFTNYDSPKGRQIAANPRVALVFYWDALERQVRVIGIAERLAERESDEYFQARPVASRIGAAASPQSSVIGGRSQLQERVDAAERAYEQDGRIERPPNWGGFIVHPDTFEFWQGRSSRLHDRIRFVRDSDNWRMERLAP